MSVAGAINLDDLKKMAKRRLPKVIFDYVEGGCDDEGGLIYDQAARLRYRLVPRYCVNVSHRDTTATVFGQTYSSPIGISPSGGTGIFRRNGELMFAQAAAAANIPYVMACMSTATLEAAAALAPSNLWFQIYGSNDRAIMFDFVTRARDAGIRNLVWTVDAPVAAKRERNMRNRFGGDMPLSVKLEALRHPGWLWEYFSNGGMPALANFARYPEAKNPAWLGAQMPAGNLTWHDFEELRSRWPGALVVKGVLHPADAVKAVELGADGIYVSNHGARQLDRAPSWIDMLPLIRSAVGDKPTLMVDSGISRGSDVVLARCLGADIAFLGRPPIYGAAAGGYDGVRRVIDILTQELSGQMAQIGATRLEELGPHYLFDSLKGVQLDARSIAGAEPVERLAHADDGAPREASRVSSTTSVARAKELR